MCSQSYVVLCCKLFLCCICNETIQSINRLLFWWSTRRNGVSNGTKCLHPGTIDSLSAGTNKNAHQHCVGVDGSELWSTEISWGGGGGVWGERVRGREGRGMNIGPLKFCGVRVGGGGSELW